MTILELILNKVTLKNQNPNNNHKYKFIVLIFTSLNILKKLNNFKWVHVVLLEKTQIVSN